MPPARRVSKRVEQRQANERLRNDHNLSTRVQKTSGRVENGRTRSTQTSDVKTDIEEAEQRRITVATAGRRKQRRRATVQIQPDEDERHSIAADREKVDNGDTESPRAQSSPEESGRGHRNGPDMSECEDNRDSPYISFDLRDAETLGQPWSKLATIPEEVRQLEASTGRPKNCRQSEIRQICAICRECYIIIREQVDGRVDESAVVERLHRVSSLMAEMRTNHDNDATESSRHQDYLSSCYWYLIPHAVRLLLSVINSYRVRDRALETPGIDMSIEHAQSVSDLCADIAALGKDLYTREKPKQLLVKFQGHLTSAHINVIMPIRSVMDALLRTIEDNRQRELHEQRMRVTAVEEAERQRIEAFQEEYRRARKYKIAQWQRLHEWRRYSERGFLSLVKQNLLAYEELPHAELDADGLPFERVDVFAPLRVRVGPSLLQMQAARAKSWSIQQEQDLCEGLKDFAGEDVLIRIFSKYCGKSLTNFSVSDIVTHAADLRERWLLESQESQQTAPAWVQQIPVWTRPHAIGKENEENVG